MATQRVKAIELKELDVSTVPAAWGEIGTGLPNACSVLRIINASDVDVGISYDGGTTINDYLEAHDVLQFPSQNAAFPSSDRWLFPAGFKVYAKPDAGGTGYVMVTGYYQ